MIGRAAVQMPWIFEAIRRNHADDSTSAPYRIDLEQTALSFLHYLEAEQPPEFFLTRAQRFFQFYCDNFSFAHYCRTQLLRAQNREEMERVLHTYFEQSPSDKLIEI